MTEETPVLFNFSPGGYTDPLDSEAPGERQLPVVPLHDTVIFPRMVAPLFLSNPAAVAAVEEALAHDGLVLALTRRETAAGDELNDLYDVGVEGTVRRSRKMPDGSTSVVIEGRRRMRATGAAPGPGALRARAAPLYVEQERTIAVEAMTRAALALFEKVVRLSRSLPDDAYTTALNVDDPGGLADLIASTLPLPVAVRQQILETLDPEERLHRVSTLLTQELDVLELESRIHSQVQKEVDRSQRELFLREQLKVIQRELGQEDPAQREVAAIRERAAAATLPAAARARVDEELARLEVIPPLSPEYSVVRTYLDWVLALPWATLADSTTADLRQAARTLDANHFGLTRVKDRILEFLAVRQLAGPRQRSPILCLVGPPGVGKTSLGRSIAEAVGRPFVRLSLGGVRDEAEIRGHRRTYIGAMPGRVLQRMKEAAVLDPVFMLDEIDKLGADFRGDPADALLEVLDPELNDTFSDHYLDTPFDLSKVFFITSANHLDEIPEPLLDRMEVIELPGYTEEDKLQIARRFLVPRQHEANGLPPATLRFGEATIRAIVRGYTAEAGVRNLEREIGAICRKTARRVAEGRPHPRVITPALATRLLGPPRYDIHSVEERDQVGLATGMVYTGAGGDTMPVEVSLMEGKGNLTLTGQLGEVMQESAQAALSYARANAAALGIDARRFEKLDIHVHVPEGATPKEGPSAGITIAVTLISALTGRTVRRDIAMTGELTLRGNVLPIGGVVEKVLGAYRVGIREVILPRKNGPDLVEVPAAVRGKMRVHLVAALDEVLALVLGPPPPRPERRTARKVITRAREEE